VWRSAVRPGSSRRWRWRGSLPVLILPALLVLAAACGPGPGSGAGGQAPTAPPAAPPPAVAPEDIDLTDFVVEIHRSEACGCCGEYEEYLTDHGFTVHNVIRDDLLEVKETIGLPIELGSCHTSFIGGYFMEGHVPVEAIRQLLAGQPSIDGIALPGMPAGAPGMGGVQQTPFIVMAVTGGRAAEFGSY
jgi:hypothetical protein